MAKNILITVAYYDAMDFPMTSFEVWKYLTRLGTEESGDGHPYSLEVVREALDDSQLLRYLEQKNGFYFLSGREELVNRRLKRQIISHQKIRRLKKYAYWLKMMPFVRMIAITGRLALGEADYESDWDLLIVCESKRLFIARSAVTLMAEIMGRRRKGKKVADRLCLNAFLTADNLEINLKDMFSASEYFWARPIFGFSVFRQFQLENGWIQKYKPNFIPENLPPIEMLKDGKFSHWIRSKGEKLLDWDYLENKLAVWQLGRIEKDPRTHQKGSAVWADRERLLFFPEPKSPKIYDAFQASLERIKHLSQMLDGHF